MKWWTLVTTTDRHFKRGDLPAPLEDGVQGKTNFGLRSFASGERARRDAANESGGGAADEQARLGARKLPPKLRRGDSPVIESPGDEGQDQVGADKDPVVDDVDGVERHSDGAERHSDPEDKGGTVDAQAEELASHARTRSAFSLRRDSASASASAAESSGEELRAASCFCCA